MNIARTMGPSGSLTAFVTHRRGPSRRWTLANKLRASWWGGILGTKLAKLLTRFTGIPTLTSELTASVVRANGLREDFGVVSKRVVTTVGATAIRDAFMNTLELETFNFHACGTGTTAEAVGDTALVTELTTELSPDGRVTGTQSTPAANQYRSSGVFTFDAAGPTAVTEHGLVNQTTVGGSKMFDRSVFAAINVYSGDTITFNYTLTINSGG